MINAVAQCAELLSGHLLDCWRRNPAGKSHSSTKLLGSNLGALSNLGDTQLTHLPSLGIYSSYSFCKSFCSKSPSSEEPEAKATAAAEDEKRRSFVVSYLINSCGLSPERAVSKSRCSCYKLRFESSKKPDEVLAFLRNHGFTNEDITWMVISDPRVLLCKEENLSAKFEFFYSIGFTKQDLPAFISKVSIWRKSLGGFMIPLHRLLKNVLRSDEDVVHALKNMGWLLKKTGGYKGLEPNIALLKEIGVPSSKISLLMRLTPFVVLFKPDKFRKLVYEAKALGFDVSKSSFIQAIPALNSGYVTTRDRCMQIYKEWGLSKDDILSAFLKTPQCLLFSENKLRETLDFLVNKMGWQPEAIIQTPQILLYSLEKRLIPRCSVIHVLIQKGLLGKGRGLLYALVSSEKRFLDRFVYNYDHIASQLLLVYQRKADPFKETYI
ncbi:Transcription termination factor MTERF15, mitochondrial-like protein [Drosera capensis]